MPDQQEKLNHKNITGQVLAIAQRPWLLRPLVQIGMILFIGLGLYLRAMDGPFIFDDYVCIIDNPAIRNIGFFTDFSKVLELNISSDIKNSFVLRTVAYLTFALNYRFGQFDVSGYHLFNLLIHLTNALLVYLLVLITARPIAGGRTPKICSGLNSFLPFLAALLFVAHPIQTQAVTYIVQRFTSLATLFYLSALLLYIQARTTSTSCARWCFYGSALIVTIAAMKTKEIAFTLPMIMLLYDLFFLTGRGRTRLMGLLPFFLTMAIIPGTLLWLIGQTGSTADSAIEQSINLVNFAKVSHWDYLKTQFGVIVYYLRLLVLPYGQNLDHDYLLAKSFFTPKVMASFLLILTLLSVAIWSYVRSLRSEATASARMRLVSFGILWFLLTISSESSIIPINDLLVEHRLYLPSVGFFLSVLVLAEWFAGSNEMRNRIVLAGGLLAIIALSITTLSRNELYRDPIRMYLDVVGKSPAKLRAHTNLGLAYLDRQQYDEAINEFDLVLSHRPDEVDTLVSLGYALLGKGLFDNAIFQFKTALHYAPDNCFAHGNLGAAYQNKWWHSEAEKEYRIAVELDPHFGGARKALAQLYEKQGRTAEAIMQYRAVLESYPNDQNSIKRLRQLTGAFEM